MVQLLYTPDHHTALRKMATTTHIRPPVETLDHVRKVIVTS
jgi:hypothetical protein